MKSIFAKFENQGSLTKVKRDEFKKGFLWAEKTSGLQTLPASCIYHLITMAVFIKNGLQHSVHSVLYCDREVLFLNELLEPDCCPPPKKMDHVAVCKVKFTSDDFFSSSSSG